MTVLARIALDVTTCRALVAENVCFVDGGGCDGRPRFFMACFLGGLFLYLY